MQYHEYANLFPMMSADERARLLDDMQRNGYDESAPIVTYQGKILDGRNRYEVAQELGIYPPTVEYEGGDALRYVIRHNLNRRHLSESQRALIARRLETMKHGGARNFQDANLHLERGEVTRSEAAELLNVSPRMVASVKAIEREAPEYLPRIENGEMTVNDAQRRIKSEQRAEQLAEIAAKGNETEGEKWRVFQADIMTWQPEKLFDIIITDPPYPREYLPLWEVLAYQAAKWLKPGGLVVAMSGQSYLPEIHAAMSKHLTYWWECAYLTPGGQSAQVWPRKVNPFWKPLLIYSNGEYTGKWFGDVCKSAVNDNDKDYHIWGQSVSGMSDIIDRFCEPGFHVLDPFCGASTTGIAALKGGCLYTGIDTDQEKVKISSGRLSEWK